MVEIVFMQNDEGDFESLNLSEKQFNQIKDKKVFIDVNKIKFFNENGNTNKKTA